MCSRRDKWLTRFFCESCSMLYRFSLPSYSLFLRIGSRVFSSNDISIADLLLTQVDISAWNDFVDNSEEENRGIFAHAIATMVGNYNRRTIGRIYLGHIRRRQQVVYKKWLMNRKVRIGCATIVLKVSVSYCSLCLVVFNTLLVSLEKIAPVQNAMHHRTLSVLSSV